MSAEIQSQVDNVMLERQAWHRLGTVVGAQFSWADAVADGQPITLPVEKVPMRELIFGIAADGSPLRAPEDEYANVRSDGLVLATGLGEQSTVWHASEGNLFGQAIQEAAESAEFEANLVSLGTLYGGRTWFMTYGLGTYEVIGYTIKSHLTIAGSYDASRAATAVDDDTVVVCANTLRAHYKGRKLYRFKHTSGIFDRVEEAKRALVVQRANQAAAKAQIEQLAVTPVSGRLYSNLITALFPVDEEGQNTKSSNVNAKAREQVTSLYKGSGLITGTPVTDGDANGWSFVQAVNTYENWGKPVRATKGRSTQETQLYRQAETVLNNTPQVLTDKAVELVLN